MVEIGIAGRGRDGEIRADLEQQPERDAVTDAEFLEQRDPFIDTDRQRFSSRPERCKAGTPLIDQPGGDCPFRGKSGKQRFLVDGIRSMQCES